MELKSKTKSSRVESPDVSTELRNDSSESKNPNGSQVMPRSNKRHLDRISLKAEALARVERWITQAEQRYKAIRISRTELVNFLILHRAAELSEEEARLLGEAHYDEVKFATWALKALKDAHARGEKVSLDDLIRKHRNAPGAIPEA